MRPDSRLRVLSNRRGLGAVTIFNLPELVVAGRVPSLARAMDIREFLRVSRVLVNDGYFGRLVAGAGTRNSV